MTVPETSDRAWKKITQYAKGPDATIETASWKNENEIRIDQENELILFQREGKDERPVTREEFDKVWNQLLSPEGVTREQVGDITSKHTGSALFGALNDIFDLELDTSTSSMTLCVE